MKQPTKIMIVAGEASGDRHASRLINAIREMRPDVDFEVFGAAGPQMREAGVNAVVESDELSVVGVLEIAKALPIFLSASRKLKKAAKDRQPAVVVLVDFPDFNLKIAKSLKKTGHKIVYYISPQLWAWRQYRISTIRNYVDLLLTILPFEKNWYAERGVSHVEYVGNPLTREVASAKTREQFCSDHGLDPEATIIAVLPGSRHKEIVRILPVMLGAAVQIERDQSNVQFVIAASSESNRRDIDSILKIYAAKGLPKTVVVVEGETYEAIAAADAATVTSGTATLETGILGTPLAIVYRSSAINYVLLRPLIDVEHYGLINLAAGERIATELIQYELTDEKLAAEMLRLIEPVENKRFRAKLAEAAEKLGEGGASKRAAAAILNLLE